MSSDWNIDIWESGSTWTSDGTIPRPNADVENEVLSNLNIIKLADGSEGFLYPTTKTLKGTMNMTFIDTTSAFRTKILSYINNGEKIRITTHDSQVFTGRFIDYKRVWLVGVSPDSFDIQLTFKEVA